ncbi:MAG TPA: hypothetical protein VGI39_08055, partial [Polyangiaceae bacterium]
MPEELVPLIPVGRIVLNRNPDNFSVRQDGAVKNERFGRKHPNVVPRVPAGFVPSNPKDYRGFRPKSSELAVVPDVVIELESFSDYVAVFAKTAPPEANIAQALDASLLWTAMLADSTEWFGYVKSQEGMAWKDTLTLVDKLKGPFALASQ